MPKLPRSIAIVRAQLAATSTSCSGRNHVGGHTREILLSLVTGNGFLPNGSQRVLEPIFVIASSTEFSIQR